MGIRRSVSGYQRLRYHQLFGLSERPPFGIAKLVGYGDEFKSHDASHSWEEYQAEVDAIVKKGTPLKGAKRQVSEKLGIRQWYAGTGYLGMVTLPRRLSASMELDMPHAKSEPHKFNPAGDNVIAGWWYNRSRGIGPGDGVSAWVATELGFLAKGPSYLGSTSDHSETLYSHEPRIIGINVFENWQALGVFEEARDEFDQPLFTAARAVRAIYHEYTKLHGVKIPAQDVKHFVSL